MALETETSNSDTGFADGVFDAVAGKPLDGTADMDKGSGATKQTEKAPDKSQAIDPTKVDAKQTDGEKKPDDAKTGEAKPLELKFPDGVKLDEKLVGDVKSIFTEGKVDSAVAQKLVDRFIKAQADNTSAAAKAQQAALDQMVDGWKDATKKDKEIGGAKYDESVALAKKGLSKFGTDALAKALKDSGFSSHPEFIRLFSKVGRALSEDTVKGSQGGGAAGDKPDPLKQRYPTMYPKE